MGVSKQNLRIKLGLCTVIGGAMLVSACSKVPDAINPAAWYRTTSDFIAGKDSGSDQTASDTTAPGAEGSAPNLARVDQQMADRKAAQEGLAADTQGRKYAESVQRQDESAQDSLYAQDSAPTAPQVEAQQIAPAPQPATPVQTAQPAPQPSAAPQPPAAPATTETASVAPTAGADTEVGYGVDPGMRARLAQQLAEIQARAADQGSLLPLELTSGGQGQPTVIISSGGIEMAMAPSLEQLDVPQFGAPLAGQIQNSGALPLPAGATKVATILFSNGSHGLDANDRRILADVARLQKQNNGVIRVVGHASQRTKNLDPVVHKMTNFQVSVKRANRVVAELKKMGVASDRILTAAVGDNQPVYLEVMPSGEAGNRRTEIFLSN